MRFKGRNAASWDEYRLQGTGLSDSDDKQANLRRIFEVAAWIVLVAVLWGTDLLAKLSVRDQTGIGKDTFRLVSEQVTSAVAVLIMVLFLVQWLKLFPIRRDAWARAVIGHTIGMVIFAFGHFALMVALRIPWYAMNGRTYVWRDPFVANLFVEYQKDIKIYIGFVLVIAAYQYYRRSRSDREPVAADRLVVQTGSGERVLRFDEIDYLQADKNYIAVFADGREYLVRETMANVSERLSAGPFVRTHRSFIVNIDKVQEIRTVDSAQRILLSGGEDIPLSRGFRDEFDRRIGGK